MTLRIAIPAPIRRGKNIVDSALHAVSESTDRAAEVITHRLLGIVPRSAATHNGQADVVRTKQSIVQRGEYVRNTPAHTPLPYSTQSRFADAEEISWLESGRRQLPYRRDTLWAVPQMWWEMTFGQVGAAAYIAAGEHNQLGRFLGYGMVLAGKGSLLAADLGRPERLLRVFAKPGTSWIARGSWAFLAFAGAGGLSLVPLPKPVTRISRVAATAAGAVVMSYDALFLKDSKAVASWRPTALLPLYVTNGALSGMALASAVAPRAPQRATATTLAAAALASGVSATMYIAQLAEGNTAQRLSARDLVEGIQRERFLILGGLFGTFLPLAAAARHPFIRALGAAGGFLGSLAYRRSILQAGIHAPVFDPPRLKAKGPQPW